MLLTAEKGCGVSPGGLESRLLHGRIPGVGQVLACQSFLRRLLGGMEYGATARSVGSISGATSPEMGVMTSTTRADRRHENDHHAAIDGG
jgi:hypothetical protein